MDYSQSTQCSAYSEESDSAQRAKSGGLDHANHVLAVLSNERMSPLRSQLQKHWEDEQIEQNAITNGRQKRGLIMFWK